MEHNGEAIFDIPFKIQSHAESMYEQKSWEPFGIYQLTSLQIGMTLNEWKTFTLQKNSMYSHLLLPKRKLGGLGILAQNAKRMKLQNNEVRLSDFMRKKDKSAILVCNTGIENGF